MHKNIKILEGGENMTKEQFEIIIDLLDESIMRKVQRNYSVSINEEEETEKACEKVLGRKATDDEFNKVFISDEFTSILDEIDDFIRFREKAKESKGHFEDFTHDNPFGSKGGFRYDKQ
jgi:hypothetical protein